MDRAEHDALEIKVITADMVEEALAFLTVNFYPDEPVRRSLEGGGPLLLDSFTKFYIADGWSLAAVDKGGKIVGMRVGKVVTSDNWKSKLLETAPVKRLLCLVSNLTHPYNSLSTYYLRRELLGYSVSGLMARHRSKQAYIGQGVCTAPDYRGHGLATRLVAASLELARTSGCDHVFVCVSGNYSSRLFDRLGFSVESELRYDEFLDKHGAPLIKDTREHVKAQVRARKIDL